MTPSLLSFGSLSSRRTTALRIAEYQKQLEDHDRDAAQELDQLTTALLKKLKTRDADSLGFAGPLKVLRR